MTFRDSILSSGEQRRQNGLWRQPRKLDATDGVRIEVDGRELVNFSSNDYLGLASSDELKSALAASAAEWGVGATASHLVCGHQRPHQDLENEIAEFTGAEKAIVFSTGYMANLAVPAAMLSRHDLLLQDKLNHASLIDAGQLCLADTKRYRHLDHNHAAEILQQQPDQKTLIATDGVFSMNGNVAPIVELHQQCTENENRLLLVDDAHGFGVLGSDGKGSLEQHGMIPQGPILMIGTLSKSVGCFGAFVAGDAIWIEHLIQSARPFIYTTALPCPIAVAARTAIGLIRQQPWRREKLHENVATFRKLADEHNIELLPSQTPIQSVVFGSPESAVAASETLQSKGFLVVAIRPPTVPAGTSRLRITLSTDHSQEQISALVKELRETTCP